jgi:hypothetical protein
VSEQVATRNQEGLLGAARADNRAVREHSAFARVQHNLSTRNFGNYRALDGNQIAGKDGGQHARTEHPKTNFPERADYIGRQVARYRRRNMLPWIHRGTNRRAMTISR